MRGLDNKRKVASALTDADAKLAVKNYEGCLAALLAGKAALTYEVDQIASSTIQEAARRGMSIRDNTHKKLVDELDEWINARNLPGLPEKINALVKFRAAYPKTDWQPTVASLHYRLATAYVAEKSPENAFAQFDKVLQVFGAAGGAGGPAQEGP